MEIKDKKGSDNMISHHLSRFEKISEKEKEPIIAENFPNEQVFLLSIQTPW